jgi:prepilin-type N-terminal cleavage/methylation domain-containing protein
MAAGLGSGRRARARRTCPVAVERASEQGFTLVEILISVWIMGALMVVFMGALLVMTKSSDLSRRTTFAETELRHFVEAVQNAPYVPCAAPSDYTNMYHSSYSTSDITYSLDSSGVQFWDPYFAAAPDAPGGPDSDAPQTFKSLTQFKSDVTTWNNNSSNNGGVTVASCVTGAVPSGDAGTQEVTLQVTVLQGSSLTLTQQVIKRDTASH